MRRATPLITLAATLLALPAASQQGKAPPTNLYIDVATHNMAGMPDMGAMMGGLGGFMAKRMGGGFSLGGFDDAGEVFDADVGPQPQPLQGVGQRFP